MRPKVGLVYRNIKSNGLRATERAHGLLEVRLKLYMSTIHFAIGINFEMIK